MKIGIREILFLAALFALLGGAWFIFSDRSAARTQRLAGMEAKQVKLANLRQSIAGIDDLGRKIEELQQAIHFFESKLPQEKEVDKILKDVWDFADANNLQTRTIRTLRGERAANYSEQPIQMNLSGDFQGFYTFLLELEKLSRITRVTQMNLTKINDRNGAMEAQLTLSIFFEPEMR
jgi:type IV pilus assembly protein PilO